MLKQIRVRYDPIEDRLFLHVGLSEPDSDLILALTRRVFATWRQDLQQMIDLSAELPAAVDKGVKAVVSAAHHRALASQSPVRREPATAETLASAAATQCLVTEVRCGRRRSDRRWVLTFLTREHEPLRLVLGDKTLHGLVEAVLRRARAAHWDLALLPMELHGEPGKPGAGGTGNAGGGGVLH